MVHNTQGFVGEAVGQILTRPTELQVGDVTELATEMVAASIRPGVSLGRAPVGVGPSAKPPGPAAVVRQVNGREGVVRVV
jgi:hypothetical protein